MFSCVVGREEHSKQISLACVGSARSVWTTVGLLQLQVAQQGHCPKWALCFMYFPGLSCSGSGSRVLHRSTDSVGCVFCALPRSEQLRQLGAWRAHCPRWAVHLNHLPGPTHLVSQVRCESTVSGVPCVSSGELISGCDPPGRCQPSRIPERLG